MNLHAAVLFAGLAFQATSQDVPPVEPEDAEEPPLPPVEPEEPPVEPTPPPPPLTPPPQVEPTDPIVEPPVVPPEPTSPPVVEPEPPIIPQPVQNVPRPALPPPTRVVNVITRIVEVAAPTPTSSSTSTTTSASTPTATPKSTAGSVSTQSDATTSSVIIAVVFILLLFGILVGMLIRRRVIRNRATNSVGGSGRFEPNGNIERAMSNPFMKQKFQNVVKSTPQSIASPLPGMESMPSVASSQPQYNQQAQYVDYNQQSQYFQPQEQQQYTQQQHYQPQPEQQDIYPQYPAFEGNDNGMMFEYQQLQNQFHQMTADPATPPQPSYVPNLPPLDEHQIPELDPDSDARNSFLNNLDSNSRPSSHTNSEEEPAQSVLQTLMNQQQSLKVGRFEVTRSELSPEEYVDRAKSYSIYSDI